jgi:rhodanese-related sulfurtransferase
VRLFDLLRPTRPFRQLSPAEAQSAAASGSLLIDVRDQEDWDAGHAPMALHVPFRRLAERVTRLPKGKELVLICHSGGRSKTSAEVLAEKGLPVAWVNGGMRAWAKAGLPLVGPGGRSGSVR